jgi:hypothetical protein
MRPQILVLPLSLIVLAVAGLIAFTAGGSASSAPQAAQPAAGTVTEHAVLMPEDFFPENVGCVLHNGDDGGIEGRNTPDPCQEWRANFRVPDNATLKNARVYYMDNNTEFENIYVAVHASAAIDSTGYDTDLSGQLPDTAGARQAGDITADVPVDNVNYHYDVRFTLDTPAFLVYSVVLTWEMPSPGAANANGDVNCDGAVNLGDSIGISRHLVGLPVNQPQGCPDIGA